MEDKNLNEVLYGEDFATKMKLFKEGLQEIETRHIDYFSNKENRYLKKPDQLFYHYIIQNYATKISFAFLKDSNLDETIKAECIALFNSVYK